MNGRDISFGRRYPRYHSREFLDPHPTFHLPECEYGGASSRRQFEHNPKSETGAALPFDRAIRQLRHQLDTAHELYSTFSTSFKDDIVSIKQYASEEILAELWSLKIDGFESKWMTSAERGDAMDEDEVIAGPKVEDFDEMERRVVRALNNVTDARVIDYSQTSGGRAKPYNAARRLKQKVQIAKGQILDLLGNASGSRDSCDALICELELLKCLLDGAFFEKDKRASSKSGCNDRFDQGEMGGEQICW